MLEDLGCVRFSDHSLLPGVGTYLKGGTSFKCSIEGAAWKSFCFFWKLVTDLVEVLRYQTPHFC